MRWWKNCVLLSVLVSRGLSDVESGSGPIQLIRPGEHHEVLETVPESLEKLRKIRPPVAVISAVGAVHSGKSYLLNRLRDARDNAHGFVVGYTVKPETSGLWMWESQQRRGGTAILFLDTEGFFSPNVTETYDAKLFAISTLLSSEVIYNTVKFIDNHHLELLELLIRRTNLFGLRAYARQNRASGTGSADGPISNLASFLRVLLPSQLSWVVQDFVQDLRGMSPEEWLQGLIELTMSKTGDNVGGFFKQIDCVPLPVPATDPETLGKLDLVDPNLLNPAYRKTLNDFRERLVQRAIKHPKFKGGTLKSHTKELPLMSGSDLADLVEFLVAAANGGDDSSFASSEGEPFPQVPSINEQFGSLQLRLMKSDIISIAERDLIHAVEEAYENRQPLANFPFEKERAAAEKQARALWDASVGGLVRTGGLASELETAGKEFDVGLESAFERAAARNCELIDAWCADYAGELKTEFQELAAKLAAAPRNPSELTTTMSEHRDRLVRSWGQTLAKERGGWDIARFTCCKGLSDSEFKAALQEIQDATAATNDRLIVEALDRAVRETLGTAQSSLADAASQQLFINAPEQTIIDFFAELKQKSAANFDEQTRPYQTLGVYKAKLKELEKALTKAQQDVMNEWTRKCQDSAEDFLNTASTRFPFALRRAVSLPADEGVILEVISRQSVELRRQFEKAVFCHNSLSGRPFLRRFEHLLKEASDGLQEQNVRAIRDISGRPLRELKEALLLEARHYYLPNRFESAAQKRTLAALKQAVVDYDLGGGEKEDGVPSMSHALLEKVARQFVDDDLAAAHVNIWIGLGLMTFLILALGISLVGGIRALNDSHWRRCAMFFLVAFGSFSGVFLEAPQRIVRESLGGISRLTGVFAAMLIMMVPLLLLSTWVYRSVKTDNVMYPMSSVPAVLHSSATPSGAMMRGTYSTTPEKSVRRSQGTGNTQRMSYGEMYRNPSQHIPAPSQYIFGTSGSQGSTHPSTRNRSSLGDPARMYPNEMY